MKNQSEIFFHEIRMFLPSLLDFENVLCPMPVATPPLQKSRQHRNLLKKYFFFADFWRLLALLPTQPVVPNGAECLEERVDFTITSNLLKISVGL